MMLEVFLVLTISAICCGLIGAFLVLRNLSMVSDAISHSVLLGIVLAFFLTKDIESPLLVFGAAAFGLLTVFSIESISKTGLVKNDDAVGIVFPLFFALAVILISKYARNAHIDTEIVLMGEVILAPLNRVNIFGISLPKALVHMGLMLLGNLVVITVFFKELKVSTFDEGFATLAGFSSGVLFYLIMTLSSLTAVVAFEAVGAILVVSFLITPGASAFLVTKDLKKMLLVTVLYAIVNSAAGYCLALYFNVSMAGMTAAAAGITFFLTLLFHREGMVTSAISRYRNRQLIRYYLMLLHIGNHTGELEEELELGFHSISQHLNWSEEELNKRAQWLMEQGYVYRNEAKKIYQLTEDGCEKYNLLMKEYGME